MIKYLFKLIKRIVCSILFIYGLNLVINKLGFYIPINMFSVGILTVLGFFGMIGLVIVYAFIL